MKVYLPPKKFLEEIGYNTPKPFAADFSKYKAQHLIGSYNREGEIKEDTGKLELLIAAIQAQLEAYYLPFDFEQKKVFFYKVVEAGYEMVDNAVFHGNKCHPSKWALFSIFFGPEGVVLGCKDEGKFFSSKENIRKVEKKRNIKSTSASDFGEVSANVGMSILYRHADKIKIKENTLFILIKKDSPFRPFVVTTRGETRRNR
jgi:anti-sigma regulatory factor (Ser/Thr protein kinase)